MVSTQKHAYYAGIVLNALVYLTYSRLCYYNLVTLLMGTSFHDQYKFPLILVVQGKAGLHINSYLTAAQHHQNLLTYMTHTVLGSFNY